MMSEEEILNGVRVPVVHVNERCESGEFCLQHGEDGRVEYDIERMSYVISYLRGFIKGMKDKQSDTDPKS